MLAESYCTSGHFYQENENYLARNFRKRTLHFLKSCLSVIPKCEVRDNSTSSLPELLGETVCIDAKFVSFFV